MRALLAMVAGSAVRAARRSRSTRRRRSTDPAQQARYERVIRELRCLQCRSETIADSNATLAADLRRQVREMMAAGKSDQEIFQHMTDRYGDYVLYKPPVACAHLAAVGRADPVAARRRQRSPRS